MKWVQRKAKVKPTSQDELLEQIAKIRGIEDTTRFLNPTAEELHNPYLLKNVEDASNRIIRAIASKEKIVISYDCDADGITANTIMYRYLKNYTDNVDYIYGERGDGHGITEQLTVDFDEEKYPERYKLNVENMDKVASANLLILIDSSSNDVATCEMISAMGVDIIILDHHAIEKHNPFVTMVNPQQEGCEYPNKQLSGAGVVFKTIEVMEDTLGQVDVWQYIDLVAVGMYADVMKVDVMENRYLIMHGLRNIKNPGLHRILKGGKADLYRLKCSDIGFIIAPLINGVARMDKIKYAIDILLEDDDKVCMKIRRQMLKINEERKVRQKEIYEQYLTRIDESKKVLVVMDEQSSKGFNGIVAQQLTEKYQRPVIVGRIHEGVLSGSFRSFNNFKFKKFLQQFPGEVEALGHEGAGGIVIHESQLEDLYAYIERHMPSLTDTEPTIVYDIEIDVDDIPLYVADIERLNLLYGNGFPKVVVRVNGITIEETKCIGDKQETVKFSTFDDMELIKFRVNDQYASELGFFDVVDAVGQLSINKFYHNGKKEWIITNQVMIEDYKVVKE
ncbi:DHH family phosphoesterase [Priestia aryabhattai]|uniref:single-stranded-DNA-specific exonuclease RecJ n=1 Tax=Priestia aryabhattai TaxID=412384 RepID=UPI00399F1DC4